MNSLALSDGLLLLVALRLAWVGRWRAPVMLAAALLSLASLLGVLSFTGCLPLPPWHQFFTMLGGGVSFPLLAVAFLWPTGSVNTERGMGWIAAILLAVVCVLTGVVFNLKIVPQLMGLVAMLAILLLAVRQQMRDVGFGAAVLLLGFALYVSATHWGPVQPGDFLHFGVACGLLLWHARLTSR